MREVNAQHVDEFLDCIAQLMAKRWLRMQHDEVSQLKDRDRKDDPPPPR